MHEKHQTSIPILEYEIDQQRLYLSPFLSFFFDLFPLQIDQMLKPG